jgi:hypothetical protein
MKNIAGMACRTTVSRISCALFVASTSIVGCVELANCERSSSPSECGYLSISTEYEDGLPNIQGQPFSFDLTTEGKQLDARRQDLKRYALEAIQQAGHKAVSPPNQMTSSMMVVMIEGSRNVSTIPDKMHHTVTFQFCWLPPDRASNPGQRRFPDCGHAILEIAGRCFDPVVFVKEELTDVFMRSQRTRMTSTKAVRSPQGNVTIPISLSSAKC